MFSKELLYINVRKIISKGGPLNRIQNHARVSSRFLCLKLSCITCVHSAEFIFAKRLRAIFTIKYLLSPLLRVIARHSRLTRSKLFNKKTMPKLVSVLSFYSGGKLNAVHSSARNRLNQIRGTNTWRDSRHSKCLRGKMGALQQEQGTDDRSRRVGPRLKD